MEKEILRIISNKWKDFIDYKHEEEDYRENDEYNVAEFLEWLS